MESEVKYGMVTQPLISSWKESLSIVGHAVCVHHQCRLCFLSLAGMVNHHKSCSGWTSNADFIPCTHCGARFKQFRSIQTHVEKCHTGLSSIAASTSQSSNDTRSWSSPPPPLPVTPDIVPRQGTSSAAAAVSSSVTSAASHVNNTNHPEDRSDNDRDPSAIRIDWGRRQSSSQGSSISVREDVLAEKEVQLSELENLVRQAEIKAEQVRKEKELTDWEFNLQQREIDYKRRLEEATRVIHESTSDSGSVSSPRSIVRSPEPLVDNNSSSCTNRDLSSPTRHSTPIRRITIPPKPIFQSSMQMFGPPRVPIVLPSTTKLPPSAIKLSSSALAILNAPGPSRMPLNLEDTPMNLSKPRLSIASTTSEESIALVQNTSTSSSDIPPLSDPIPTPAAGSDPEPLDLGADTLPSDVQNHSNIVHVTPVDGASTSQEVPMLPCVDIPRDKVFELSVKVVADDTASIHAGDSVTMSYPVTDNDNQTFLLDDNIVLEEFLQSSGSSEVTFVAEAGPNGQITLVPQEQVALESNEIVENANVPAANSEVDQMESEFENLRKNMEELNDIPGEIDHQTRSETVVENSKDGCDVNYFENRIRDFENEIIHGKEKDVASDVETMGKEKMNNRLAEDKKDKKQKSNMTQDKRPAEETLSRVRKKQKVEDPHSTKEKPSPVTTQVSPVGRRSSRLLNNSFADSTEGESIKSKHCDKTIKDKSSYQCGRCNSVLKTERSWIRHRDAVHGGCARLHDHPDGQYFSKKQEDQAWRQALRSQKKINCPRCGQSSFVKIALLETHLKTCLSITPTIEDDERNVKPTKKVQVRHPDPISENEEVIVNKTNKPLGKTVVSEAIPTSADVGVDSPRSKRRAATKARSTVAAFVEAMKTKSDDGSSDIADILEDDEDSDDNYNVQSEFNIKEFYKQTKSSKRSTFICNMCGCNFKKKTEVENHILTIHKDEISQEEDDDIDDSEEGSESGTDFELDDELDSGYSGPKRKRKKVESSSSSQRRLILEPCSEAAEFEAKFLENCSHSNKVFDLKSTSPWKDTKDENFLPKCRKSLRFAVNDLLTPGIKQDCAKIDQFSGIVLNKSPMMFCGGPVTAMAWCSSAHGPNILAVAAKLQFESSTLSNNNPEPGLLQFWSVTKDSAPVFLFGLCHNYGNVWGLDWCPDIHQDEDENLGLISAGCTDGSVRVWSIPELSSLSTGSRYVKEADLSLFSGDDDIGQCLDLSWYRGPGNGYIAACYTSGMVCVWHLTSQSPLLRPDDHQLLPVQAWLAHHGSVSSVSMCPGHHEQPRYLITGGSDRCYKFWDLRDTSVPLQEVKRGLVADVEWVPGWSGAGVSYDDVYLQGHTQSLLAETGFWNNKSHPVISQNSSVTKMSMSRWLGTLAVSTSAGELIVFVLPSLERSLEHDKNLPQRRCYVFRTEVIVDDQDMESDIRNYETAVSKTRIMYHDNGLHHPASNPASCPPDELRRVRVSENMSVEDLSRYPVAGLSCVTWNNNPGLHTMLASGGQAGIVRIHNLESLRTNDIQKLLPSGR